VEGLVDLTGAFASALEEVGDTVVVLIELAFVVGVEDQEATRANTARPPPRMREPWEGRAEARTTMAIPTMMESAALVHQPKYRSAPATSVIMAIPAHITGWRLAALAASSRAVSGWAAPMVVSTRSLAARRTGIGCARTTTGVGATDGGCAAGTAGAASDKQLPAGRTYSTVC